MFKTIIKLLCIAALLWLPFWLFLNKALLMAYSRNYVQHIRLIGASEVNTMIEAAFKRGDDILVYIYSSNCFFCSYNTGNLINAELEARRERLSFIAVSLDPSIEGLNAFLNGFWREIPFVPYVLKRGEHEALMQYMRNFGMNFSLEKIPYVALRKSGRPFTHIAKPLLGREELVALLAAQ